MFEIGRRSVPDAPEYHDTDDTMIFSEGCALALLWCSRPWSHSCVKVVPSGSLRLRQSFGNTCFAGLRSEIFERNGWTRYICVLNTSFSFVFRWPLVLSNFRNEIYSVFSQQKSWKISLSHSPRPGGKLYQTTAFGRGFCCECGIGFVAHLEHHDPHHFEQLGCSSCKCFYDSSMCLLFSWKMDMEFWFWCFIRICTFPAFCGGLCLPKLMICIVTWYILSIVQSSCPFCVDRISCRLKLQGLLRDFDHRLSLWSWIFVSGPVALFLSGNFVKLFHPFIFNGFNGFELLPKKIWFFFAPGSHWLRLSTIICWWSLVSLFPAEEDADEEVLRSVEEGFEETERCHGWMKSLGNQLGNQWKRNSHE